MRKPFRLGLALSALLLLALSAFGTYTDIQAAVTKTPLPSRTPETSETPVSAPSTGDIGTLLFSASTSAGKLNMYSVDTDGKNFKLLDVCSGNKEIRWSSDGKHLAYYDKDGKLTIADADCSNPQSFTDTGKADIDYYLAWTPDGKQLTYAALPAFFNLDVTTGKTQKLFELDKAISDVSALRWSPDSKHLAYTASHGAGINGVEEIHVVNADGTNDQVIPLIQKPTPGGIGISNSIILWSSDSQKIGYVELEGKPGIYTYDIVTKVTKPVLSLTQKGFTEVETAEWSPDSTQVAFAKYDGKVEHLFVLPTSGGNPREIPLADSFPGMYSIAWRPAVTNNEASATSAGTEASTPATPPTKTPVPSGTPKGGAAAAAAGNSQILTAANIGTLKQIAQIGDADHPITSESIVFSPDSQFLAYAQSDVIQLWDIQAGKAISTSLSGAYGALWLAFSRDGKKLIAINQGSLSSIWAWTLPDGTALPVLSPAGVSGLTSTGLSADGSLAVSYGEDKTGPIWVIDTTTGKVVFTFKVEGQSIGGAFAFSHDDKLLAIGNPNGLIQLWDVAATKLLYTLKGPGGAELEFSPDDKALASCEINGGIYQWDPGSGKALKPVSSDAQCFDNMTYSADGKFILGEEIGTAQLSVYDVSNGRQVATFPGRVGTFSLDGKLLATVTKDGILAIWGVAVKK
jgi:WD40 repeat protein